MGDSVRERLEQIAAEARPSRTRARTGEGGLVLDLRLRIYPDRDQEPGGKIEALNEHGHSTGAELVLSHVEHFGDVLDSIVSNVRRAST